MMKTDEIRQAFIDFFVRHGHRLVPGDSLIPPPEDKSLLFTGAGMNQFKAEFTGRGEPGFRRAVSSQKCLRTADLDNVGRTAYHHTFFEMLGNFSFGDYFKRESILWAWQFLLEDMKIPRERLVVSVHDKDDEALDIWEKEIGLSPSIIHRYGDHDNFWPADCPKQGPNGLCGPCSEIFYDWGPGVGCGRPECEPACDCPRFCEIWNLVFQQYDRRGPDRLELLPTKNIDTGMGLERMAAVMQGKMSNYDIDIFIPIIQNIERETGRSYQPVRGEEAGVRFRRIADHVRAAAFCIADGILIGRTGRGYVLRKMLRRAVRDSIFLGCEEPMLYRLVPTVAEVMPAYPALRERRENIGRLVRLEEQRFQATLQRGGSILDDLVRKVRDSGRDVLAGEEAFRLFDTYGFSAEDAESILDEAGVRIDMDGFHRAMDEQRRRSRARSGLSTDIFGGGPLATLKAQGCQTEFLGYETDAAEGETAGIIKGGRLVESAAEGEEVGIVLDRTPFYGEAGGEVGDTGALSSDEGRFEVADTQRGEGMVVHLGKVVSGRIGLGDTLVARPDLARRGDIRRNHTVTHLLHMSLRQVFGPHAEQAGSLVAPDRLRFDFTHMEALTPQQIQRVEDLVNGKILEDSPVTFEFTTLQDAKARGAMALFGEKYGETVRLLSIGNYSHELCGGLHCRATGEIGLFKIVSEGSVAAGVRRIEALTGRAAFAHLREKEAVVRELCARLKAQEPRLVDAVARLQDQVRDLKKEAQRPRARTGGPSPAELLAAAPRTGDTALVAGNVGDASAEELRSLIDQLRRLQPSVAAVLGAASDGRPLVVVGLTRDLVQKGLKANEIVRAAGEAMGGGGGGRPDLAQAGGKDAAKLDAAIEAGAAALRAKLAGA